ncbi:hypothetical protein GR209_09305 [Rhizobium leguminosarum]|nr:hypothetical protein [Rhizobium ruizarguesonis]
MFGNETEQRRRQEDDDEAHLAEVGDVEMRRSIGALGRHRDGERIDRAAAGAIKAKPASATYGCGAADTAQMPIAERTSNIVEQLLFSPLNVIVCNLQ